MNALTRIPRRVVGIQSGLQSRFTSTQPPPAAEKPASPTSQFYRTFTRPVAKVLLMATFTYQLAYWAWVKLEKDELKAQKTEEIDTLEAKLQELTKPKSP